jgi:hypothetical protein
MLRYFSIFLLIALCAGTGYSQSSHQEDESPSNNPTLFWITLGIGAKAPVGLLGHAQATYSWDVSSLSANVAATTAVKKNDDQLGVEGGLYYGRLSQTSNSIFRIAAGLGFLDLIRIHATYLGVGGEAEAMVKLGPVGLGLMLSATVTPKYSYVGITANLEIGKLF